ncbi:bifunctional phosphoribosylaminoimidazolecarboxamide formyltransferase/IMP cyclohydrolase [bacterium]|nr:bifunctional phosphoribosylaminoimidazolecarboxamide formyltransferase/IMP cyclohydrolase [bacterium]MDA9935282.1 bifunctional phosphoribosylaminoimidazolecarboxamide formyltransferase/IMP cyclohydrolase [Candidatus Neomarinimicrobiota bacterium]
MLENPKLNTENVKIKRALISVFDKANLAMLGKELNSRGIEILSTGGSASFLREKNIPVTDVSDYTNFPEIMDGRVKTINPMIEGGILGLRDKHESDATENNIKWIDLVICNLYPFSETVSKIDCDQALALENVDIGGPTMIRSAAKNVGWVTVIIDPSDYERVLENINEENEINFETRSSLSSKAFGHTAQYDTIIHNYLKESTLSNDFTLTYKKHSDMRYGENPHQAASAFQIPGDKSNGILNAKIHQGKKLSYNNIMDADAALSCLKEFRSTACVIVKHANPCGVALGANMLDVYKRAFSADSISAFGGVIAINQPCDDLLAKEISKVFVEIILAPAFTKKSLDILSKKKNLRVLEVGNIEPRDQLLEVRNIVGGLIVQETDTSILSKNKLEIVTELEPSEEEINTMLFGWKVLKHIKSNGILIVKENTTVGVGAGQVSRVDSVDIAIKKSGTEIKDSFLCSDAFFPFRDSIDKIAGSGIKAVLQPGGSIRDNEVISACNEHGIAMVFTGQRCFKH